MAMGRRGKDRQEELFVPTVDLPKAAGHPFYQRINQILDSCGFDKFVEDHCRPLYADGVGRPSLPPAIYFRLLLLGYFEGIDSERGIAWRTADSLAIRRFLGYTLKDATPDHSTISRNRRLIPVETHEEVFVWVLQVLAREGLLQGKTLGIDATTLEASAALRSIVHRQSGEGYQEFLTRLARESGIDTPTRADLARLDKDRKNKGSNQDWENPHDPDSKIAKMKDGRTHLAHKAEHAVDLESGAVVSVTIQPADRGDTKSIEETVNQVMDDLGHAAEDPQTNERIGGEGRSEIVADKGYHSDAVLVDHRLRGIRTYISEPDRGRRKWEGKPDERAAVEANRRRIRGARGRRLMGKRGELLERSFAHCYDRGGLRRTHLRGHRNIIKRVLIHVAGFNLSILLRRLLGAGTPKGWAALSAALRAVVLLILRGWDGLPESIARPTHRFRAVLTGIRRREPSQPLAA